MSEGAPDGGTPLPSVGGGIPRRSFLRAVGLGLGAAALDGCWRPPEQRILPYVEQPPEVVPGVPISYATSMTVDGYATGLLVQTREGRPIKVEGNPRHPASLGATGTFHQASLMGLYDATRDRRIVASQGPGSWDAVKGELTDGVGAGGEGLAFLLEPTSSPLRGELLARVQERFPRARIHFHTPLASPGMEAFLRLTGRPLVTRYDFGAARIVVALDADFPSALPFGVRYAHDFARQRSIDSPQAEMNRLYVAEPTPSTVASVADHDLRVRGGDVPFLLGELARAVGVAPAGLPPTPDRLASDKVQAFVRHAAADLMDHRGEGLVLVGESQPPGAHALAHRINEALGNAGRTVVLQASSLVSAETVPGGLQSLTDAMGSGAVRRLVILEANAAYTAPADVPFAEALKGLERSLYLGLHRDETGALCDTYVPSVHYLEAWGDARAYDGTLSPVQPLIRPLYDGKSPEDVLLAYLGGATASPHDALRAHWRSQSFAPASDDAFQEFWEDVLSSGVVAGTAAPTETASVDPSALLAEVAPATDGVEVAFRADPRMHDGRFATNTWLHELADPTTKLVWGNAALLSPRTARRLGVEQGEPLDIEVEGRKVTMAALPTPGHADEALTLHLGYGRIVEQDEVVGVDVYPLRTAARPHHAPATVAPGSEEVWEKHLPIVQPEWNTHGREVERHTLEEYRKDPDFTAPESGPVETWYTPPHPRADQPTARHQWAMTVDLSVCTGCGACVVACRAENNIPVVGPQDCRKGRRMDWIRIDRLIVGSEEEPEEHVRQPMLCQHCEKAPCEYVCPVNATVHSADGLNEMIYNRCVGTRFCSNNCPYKVRRFNWFDYAERREPEETLALNPDVTVRDRGVMEKCTYCVQRIRREEHRHIREGLPDDAPMEVHTACEMACPTRAIVFGDLNEEGSPLAESRKNPRLYQVLHELGTVPRTRYLAKITNPNQELEALHREGKA